jgi:hypothetical protein
MKKIAISLLSVCICIVPFSCNSAKPEPLEVRVPDGLVTATNQQEDFIEKVKTLTRGMSVSEVKQRLGNPMEESPNHLFYHLAESRVEGGHYVTATLKFGKNGLAEAELGFGHMTRSRRIEG